MNGIVIRYLTEAREGQGGCVSPGVVRALFKRSRVLFTPKFANPFTAVLVFKSERWKWGAGGGWRELIQQQWAC